MSRHLVIPRLAVLAWLIGAGFTLRWGFGKDDLTGNDVAFAAAFFTLLGGGILKLYNSAKRGIRNDG